MNIDCDILREYCKTGLKDDALLEEFKDELLGTLQINTHRLPLDDMCLHGGMASLDGIDVSNMGIKHDNGKWNGMFDVSFIEESRTSCDDIDIRRHVEGRIEFKIDIDNDLVEFEPRESREWDPHEI